MPLPITATIASLCGLLIIFLAYRVVVARRRAKVGIGDGGDQTLACAVRAHANFTEYVPLALILLAAWEINGGPRLGLWIAGGLLVVSRLIHAWGLSHRSGVSFGRFWGTAGTWLVILGLSVANLLVWF